MGYYPPLTDYLADWRMDKIKGEDLQDPTARNRISTLSQQVSSMSTSLSNLATTVSYKRDKIDGATPAWSCSLTRNNLSASVMLTPDFNSNQPLLFYGYEATFIGPIELYYDTSLSTPSWCLRCFSPDVVIGPTDLHATSMTFQWQAYGYTFTATLTLSGDTPITSHCNLWLETSAEVSNLSSDLMSLLELTEGLSKGYTLVEPEQEEDPERLLVTIANRTMSYLMNIPDGQNVIGLNFPEPQGSVQGQHSRDFIVYIDTAPRDLLIDIPSTDITSTPITYIVPEGENLSDMTTIETNIAACLYFSEVKPSTFAVHRVSFEAAV